MTLHTKSSPDGWLAFDLNVLRRLKFGSVALPFTPDPTLGTYLKRHQIRISANDLLQSSWTRALASIQNNSEKLSDDDVNLILDDVYVPGNRLANASLRTWFSETDSWWFDNVRRNLDSLQSPFAFAIGASIAMRVGDYVLSFNEETRELRQPLSTVFRRIWTVVPEPVNNGQNNNCQNKDVKEFLAEARSDLMFLRLPPVKPATKRGFSERAVWREEWLRGGNDFWPEVENVRNGKLGMPVETKSQYLRMLEDTLQTASHLKKWAVAHIETGFISTNDIAETIGAIRPVEAIYTKDFSELTGTKAVILTA